VLESEYRRVLARPQFVERHGMSGPRLDQFLKALLVRAVVDYPIPSPVRAPDPDDQMLWNLLHAVPGCFLVTGEKQLLAAEDFPGRVVSPREFIERYLAAT
jgi:predicted nucleic acid-binding protein